MEEKLKALAENEEFCKKLEQTESPEEAVKLFAEYGVEITEDELKKLMAAVPTGEIDEAALENVSGGLLTPVLGLAIAGALAYYVAKKRKKNQ